ncbi:MAG TPA: UvrD-helicase domain-containing protein [Saprospiraceae bacterium]|nr:UvrD-helicase domain-containing protein [Saprospiraceae bacterium]
MESPSYLDELNDVQQQAVTHSDGPLMVIAGPGSGKTRVLTYRIAHLIQCGVPPYRILALTFTNKAAREMKERIERVVGEQARRVWAGTFHSIFARILRVEAAKINYPPDFTIYDRDDSKSLVSEIIRELKLDPKTYNPGGVLSRISSAKSNIITPQMYEQDTELRNQDTMSKRPMIYEIYKRYTERCFRSGAMDFDDLLLQMFKLLYQNPENVREKYQRIFFHVLVDEFQDTNYLQYEILKKLVLYDGSRLNVCVVGDDAQSIYAFRGATIENMLQFEQDFHNVTVYKLEQNYRSTEHIVEAANQVIIFNTKQLRKKIWTDQLGGNKIKLVRAMTDAEEGRLVANAIIEYKNRYQLPNEEIAILYRTHAQSRVMEENLRRNNLTYRVFGGLSFYQRKEIKDMLAYIRLAVNPRDDEALRRVINYPRRGIGKMTIDRMAAYAGEQKVSLWHALVDGGGTGRSSKPLEDFIKLIQLCRQKAQQGNAHETALYIARTSGIYELLRSDNTLEGTTRLENLNALLDGIKEFTDNDEYDNEQTIIQDKSLSSYLQTIALLTDQDEEKKEKDYISLMTVHTAKGLEFSTVFVAGLEENLFPSYLANGSVEELEEERRLFYVAITRAKKYLVLSYAASRYQYGQIRVNDPSRFLEEIDHRNMETTFDIRPKHSLPEPKRIPMGKPRVSESPVRINPTSFAPSPTSEIEVGMDVIHLKFGKGKVTRIDGARDNRVATIHFNDIDDPERRIMLRFAKLQIIPSN